MIYQEMLETLGNILTFGHGPVYKQHEAVRTAIDALEELQQYRAIGTVKECQKSKERMTRKRPVDYRQYQKHAEGICPNCKCGVMDRYDISNCSSCGQALDWDE